MNICRKIRLKELAQYAAEDWKGTAVVAGILWCASLAYILIEG